MEKSQDALGENGCELATALLGRQIGLRNRWRIGPRFGHSAAEARE